VVANRVLPEEARSEYFDRWMRIQAGYLAEAKNSFDPLPFHTARLFDREMVGIPLLGEFGRQVFGERDPTEVMHVERPMRIKKEGKGYALYLQLPFADKERIQVHARGDELVIQVDNQRRNILLPRTLASRRLLGAAFADRRLRVAFGEREKNAQA